MYIFVGFCSEKKENRKKLRFLMGESMGGAMALQVHRKKPEYWDGAVLVAPMCKVMGRIVISCCCHVFVYYFFVVFLYSLYVSLCSVMFFLAVFGVCVGFFLRSQLFLYGPPLNSDHHLLSFMAY